MFDEVTTGFDGDIHASLQLTRESKRGQSFLARTRRTMIQIATDIMHIKTFGTENNFY